MPRDPRLAAFAIVLALAACGTTAVKPSQVQVDTLQTKILFGLNEDIKARQATAPGQPPQELFVQPQELPLEVFTPLPFPLAPPAKPCPDAGANDFPSVQAGTNVTSMPKPGHYRWVASGKWDYVFTGLTTTVPLGEFQERYLRNVATFTDTFPQPPGTESLDFRYQTIEPRFAQGNGYLLFFWQVKSHAFSSSETLPLPSPAPNQVTAGDPEAGLVLQRVDVMDTKGRDIGTVFSGQPGLMMLPLPEAPGDFRSTSVDTSGGATMAIQGTVGGHEVIDACGTPVQAWSVNATLTSVGTSGANGQATIHYDVATQLGGVVIGLNVDGPWFGTTLHTVKQRLGQVDPDALPEMFSR